MRHRIWNKYMIKVKTRDDHTALILHTFGPSSAIELTGNRSIIAIYQVNDKEWALNSWYADGKFYPGDRIDPLDLMLDKG